MQRAAELGETLFFQLLHLHIVGSAKKAHPYCPVCAAVASNHSGGSDCIRRATHGWIRVASKEKETHKQMIQAKLRRESIPLRQHTPRCQFRADVLHIFDANTWSHAIHTSAEL